MDEPPHEFPAQIRPLRSRSDLLAIADLVELCFAESMDPDGRDYLRYMRRLATNSFYTASENAITGSRLPVQGFLWEEDGKVVGNLTIIAFIQPGYRTYLIANVAVHPQYRRRGIARELTLKGLNFAFSHHAQTVWLHVRDDNLAAQDLYRSIGFIERVRRTTWQSETTRPRIKNEIPKGMRITHLHRRDWPLISEWLNQSYPPEVTWNFRLEKERFKPGLISEFLRFLKDQRQVHIAGYKQNRLVGSIAWTPTCLHADMLWIASNPVFDEESIPLLLGQIRRWVPASRPLSVNFPAGRAASLFEMCDFSKQNTLIWMEHPRRIN